VNHDFERGSADVPAATSSAQSSLPQQLSSARRAGGVLLGVAILGTLSSTILIALHPDVGRPTNNATSTVVGLVLWSYLLARVMKWQRAWSFALFGLVSYFAIHLVAGVVRGLERRAKVESIEERLLSALDKFEPSSGVLARAAEGDEIAMSKVLKPAIQRASLRASDRALVGILDGTIKMIDTKEGLNLPRCLSSLMGTPSPKSTQAEVDATALPVIVVLESAARNQTGPVPLDIGRAEHLIATVREQEDREGALQDARVLATLSDPDKCELYLRYLRAIRALSQSDVGLVIRYNSTPQ
jgi:hypothetical protein